jgi:hypothetical protein
MFCFEQERRSCLTCGMDDRRVVVIVKKSINRVIVSLPVGMSHSRPADCVLPIPANGALS